MEQRNTELNPDLKTSRIAVSVLEFLLLWILPLFKIKLGYCNLHNCPAIPQFSPLLITHAVLMLLKMAFLVKGLFLRHRHPLGSDSTIMWSVRIDVLLYVALFTGIYPLFCLHLDYIESLEENYCVASICSLASVDLICIFMYIYFLERNYTLGAYIEYERQ